jgi:hypothetical protein
VSVWIDPVLTNVVADTKLSQYQFCKAREKAPADECVPAAFRRRLSAGPALNNCAPVERFVVHGHFAQLHHVRGHIAWTLEDREVGRDQQGDRLTLIPPYSSVAAFIAALGCVND